LITIPGVNRLATQVILAEIGPDMPAFPSASHLLSWPGDVGRAGRTSRHQSIRHVRGWVGDESSSGIETDHILTVQFLVWLMLEVMIIRLEEELAAQPGHPGTLLLAARAARLAEIESEIAVLAGRKGP
jgi:hypothetical protein